MNKSILKAALAYLLSAFSIQGISFIVQLILLRYFAVENYGIYALSFEALITSNLIVNGAFRNFYLRELRNGVSVNNLQSYQLYFGSFWCLVCSLIVCSLFKLSLTMSLFIATAMIMTSLALPMASYFLAAGYKWRLIFRDVSVSIASLFVVIYSVFVIHASVNFIVISLLLAQVVINIIFFIRIKDIVAALNFGKLKSIRTSIIPFVGIFLLNTIYNKVGVSYISLFSDITKVAIFLAAFKFVNPFFSIQNSLISAIMPRFISKQKIDFDYLFFSFFALPGFLITISLTLLFPSITLLLGLEKYSNLYNVILFLSPTIFVVFIYGALSNYIAVSGGQSYILKTNFYAILFYISMLAIIKFILGDIMTLQFVIFSFVISESFVCILYYLKLKKTINITNLFIYSPAFVILYEALLAGYSVVTQ